MRHPRADPPCRPDTDGHDARHRLVYAVDSTGVQTRRHTAQAHEDDSAPRRPDLPQLSAACPVCRQGRGRAQVPAASSRTQHASTPGTRDWGRTPAPRPAVPVAESIRPPVASEPHSHGDDCHGQVHCGQKRGTRDHRPFTGWTTPMTESPTCAAAAAHRMNELAEPDHARSATRARHPWGTPLVVKVRVRIIRSSVFRRPGPSLAQPPVTDPLRTLRAASQAPAPAAARTDDPPFRRWRRGMLRITGTKSSERLRHGRRPAALPSERSRTPAPRPPSSVRTCVPRQTIRRSKPAPDAEALQLDPAPCRCGIPRRLHERRHGDLCPSAFRHRRSRRHCQAPLSGETRCFSPRTSPAVPAGPSPSWRGPRA